ncbi:MAG TPA: hypothetical protein VLI94_06885 [Solirubrobacterales bacterium]|nr:hypothetical protein [Solirubrobacterales bacterium]
MPRRRHPQTRDRLRWLLVRLGLLGLTISFIGLLVLLAAALALVLTLDGDGSAGFLELWRDEAMALLGLDVSGPAANQGGELREAVKIAEGLVALILPALYVGAVVFKLFVHPRVFVFRPKISVESSPETFKGELADDGHVLAFRVYNASKMRALDIRFLVVHQHWIGEGPKSIVRNIPVDVANPSWPMADCHVPYTFFVPLELGDVTAGEGGLRLVKIHGREIGSRDRLVVHVSGSMPDVAETFVERRAFDLPESLTDNAWGRIHLRYGTRSKAWEGWEGFDG